MGLGDWIVGGAIFSVENRIINDGITKGKEKWKGRKASKSGKNGQPAAPTTVAQQPQPYQSTIETNPTYQQQPMYNTQYMPPQQQYGQPQYAQPQYAQQSYAQPPYGQQQYPQYDSGFVQPYKQV